MSEEVLQQEPTIEERIKQIKGHNQCRICKHFIRLNFEETMRVYHRQGFCMLGQLEGDFGVYVSCSVGANCMGFVYSEDHYKIQMAEQNIREEMEAFCKSCEDKRTSNYKLIEPLMEAHKEFFKDAQKQPAGIAGLYASRKAHQIAREWFEKNHEEEYLRIRNMVNLRKSDYSKFLAKITVQIHDQFCSCDKIEFNPEGNKP